MNSASQTQTPSARATAGVRKLVKLDLGCGNKTRAGFVGIDRYPCEAARALGELAHLPLADGCAEEIFLDNVIEHVLDIPELMREVLRVAAPGARVTILTPHFSSQASWRDPTHLHHLSYYSMDHFEKSGAEHYVGGGFRVDKRELTFSRSLMGRIARMLFAMSAETWEKQFCFVFRARSLHFELVVEK